MTSVPLDQHVQSSDLGAKVELWHFDLSMFGEADLYLTPGDENSSSQEITFDGQVYTPYAFKAEGHDVSTSGPLARPKLSMANTSGILTTLVRANNNLQGAIVTRTVTFARYLDDGVDPDPDAIYSQDTYMLRKKTNDVPAKGTIEWEMGALVDAADDQLPGRTVVRDFCDQSYRIYVAETDSFDYTNATCPYTGTTYLDENDEATTKSGDKCSKRLNGGCKGRFGTDPLPFRGFPGVARFRA